MTEQPAKRTPVTPRGVATMPPVAKRPSVDKFPKDPAEWRAFAAMPAVERAAVYLRSIRAMLLFFTVLTILGIIAGVVFGLLGIDAIDQSNTPTTTNSFG